MCRSFLGHDSGIDWFLIPIFPLVGQNTQPHLFQCMNKIYFATDIFDLQLGTHSRGKRKREEMQGVLAQMRKHGQH